MNSFPRGFWLLFLLCGVVPNPRAADVPGARVTGIFRLGSMSRVLLDLNVRSEVASYILAEGEKGWDYTVVAINEKAATVTLRHGDDPLIELNMEQERGDELGNRTLHFNSVKLEQVLKLYEMLSEQTAICASTLPDARLELKSGAGLSKSEALALLRKALEQKGVVVEPRGDKFVVFVPAGLEKDFENFPEPPVLKAGIQEEIIALGVMTFYHVDPLQVLDVYSDFTQRAVLRPHNLPPKKLTIKNKTAVTRSEACWMLEALFRVEGIALVKESEKFVFAVPVSRGNRLPKFNAAAAAAKARAPGPPGVMKFLDSDLAAMLQIYAELLGREALPIARNVPPAKFSLRTPMPFSEGEAIFALEALASLNNLTLELVGDNQVQLIPSAEAKPNK